MSLRLAMKAGLAALALCCALAVPALAESGAPVLPCRVLETHPHDPGAFTQGLVFVQGGLYESTGKYGASSLRQVDPATGRVLRQAKLPADVFAEGLAPDGDRLILLTWKSGRALVFDRATFQSVGSFAFEPQGWGLTTGPDGTLWQSRGDQVLIKRDPATFLELGRVEVRDGNGPVGHLNELEWVGDTLLANVWLTDLAAVIDPDTGRVQAYIDLSPLRDELGSKAEVANGLAWEPQSGRLYVTGKFWDKLFVIQY